MHASKFKNSYLRNKTEIFSDFPAIYKEIKQQKYVQILEGNPVFDSVWKILSGKYAEMMIENHRAVSIVPMSQA